MQQIALFLVVAFLTLQPAPRTLASERSSGADGFDQQAALELGRQVEAVRQALQHPGEPGALATIVGLGHDQRHYVMVRGWLAWQLRGDLGIQSASGDRTPGHITTRIELIQEAIRAIDLE